MIKLMSIDVQGDKYLLSYRNESSTAKMIFESERKAKSYFAKVLVQDICRNIKAYSELQKNIAPVYFNADRMLAKKFDQYRTQYYKLIAEVGNMPLILTLEPARAQERLKEILFHVISTLPPELKIKNFDWPKNYAACYELANEIDKTIDFLKKQLCDTL